MELGSADALLAEVEGVLTECSPKSGTGFPLSGIPGLGTVRGVWLTGKMTVCLVAVARLIKLMAMPVELVGSMSPIERVQSGLCDIVRWFIKDEPHRLAKAQQGLWRLIAHCAFVDQLVARVLHSRQNKRELANWAVIPSQPGFGFQNSESRSLFASSVFLRGDMIASSDVIRWDWSAREWMLWMDLVVRYNLQKFPDAETARRWWNASANALHCVIHAVFAYSDGFVFQQLFRGLMKSGWYLTSSTNSRMRAALAMLVGASWAKTMGDDCVEKAAANAVREYARRGFEMKDWMESMDQVEFCSHIFRRDGTYEPVKWIRMFFSLITSEPKTHSAAVQLLESFLRDVGPEIYTRCYKILEQVGWASNVSQEGDKERTDSSPLATA